jgi:hypothetical protein
MIAVFVAMIVNVPPSPDVIELVRKLPSLRTSEADLSEYAFNSPDLMSVPVTGSYPATIVYPSAVFVGFAPDKL